MLNKNTFFWYNKKTSYDQKGQGFGFMNYSINYSSFSSVFALPTLSEQTLCIASGQALRVLLYLMQHQTQMKTIQPQYLADRLLLDVSQVLEALDFWAGEGILNRDSSAQAVQQTTAYTAPQPISRQTSSTVLQQPVSVAAKEQNARVSMGLRAQKKTMAIDEIHTLAKDDNSIQQLVDAVQVQMGKVLTRSEIETVVSFYTYAGLPPEYILLATAHCCSQNRGNVRALSKLLTDMMSEQIYTYEQAEEYLTRRQQQDSAQGQVRAAFGIHDRSLTKQEQKYIDTWFMEYHFDISMVKLAYERTIDQIGKVSFPYTNKILTSWHEKGITNPKDAVNERQSAKAMAKTEASSIDFDQIQQFITYGGVKPE